MKPKTEPGTGRKDKPIWPIAGMAWPGLVLIGLRKAWENRNDR